MRREQSKERSRNNRKNGRGTLFKVSGIKEQFKGWMRGEWRRLRGGIWLRRRHHFFTKKYQIEKRKKNKIEWINVKPASPSNRRLERGNPISGYIHPPLKSLFPYPWEFVMREGMRILGAAMCDSNVWEKLKKCEVMNGSGNCLRLPGSHLIREYS